jgi:hypothetical protein
MFKLKHQFLVSKSPNVLDGRLKEDIMGDIDTTLRDIKTLEPFVHITVPKKNTSSGTELEFMGIIGSRPACTAKDSETRGCVVD